MNERTDISFVPPSGRHGISDSCWNERQVLSRHTAGSLPPASCSFLGVAAESPTTLGWHPRTDPRRELAVLPRRCESACACAPTCVESSPPRSLPHLSFFSSSCLLSTSCGFFYSPSPKVVGINGIKSVGIVNKTQEEELASVWGVNAPPASSVIYRFPSVGSQMISP